MSFLHSRLSARFQASRPAALAVLAALLTIAAVACGGDEALRPTRTPNIILVTVDTLRADHIEAWGYFRETSPVLSRLAATGVRFEHAVSQAPWTLPSMASVHTGLYPSQHGAVEAETAMPEAAATLAELLQSVGYRTVGVISHEFVSRKHGFAQGFEVFDEANVLDHEAVTSKDITLAALAGLSDASEPFFLWVHYFDPHFTYVRHPEVGFANGYTGVLPDKLTSGLLQQYDHQAMSDADLEYVEAVYDEEIAHTDLWLGNLWDALSTRYGAENNVLIFTSDHGEYFLERGRFFHGKDVYEELVHVPLLIGGAIDEALAGTVVAETVAPLSIPATVMGLLGIREHGFAGQDLLEVARGAAAAPVFTEGSWAFGTDERKRAVVYDDWKLIHRLDDDAYELYELSSDPNERDDRWAAESTSQDGVASVLLPLLERFEDLPRLAPQPVGVSPEALERLRGLGYIR